MGRYPWQHTRGGRCHFQHTHILLHSCEADQIDDCLEPFPRVAHSFSKVPPEELAHAPASIWSASEGWWYDTTHGQDSWTCNLQAVKLIVTCNASQEDATIKCWGNNQFGQLGYGDTSDRGAGINGKHQTLTRNPNPRRLWR